MTNINSLLEKYGIIDLQRKDAKEELERYERGIDKIKKEISSTLPTTDFVFPYTADPTGQIFLPGEDKVPDLKVDMWRLKKRDQIVEIAKFMGADISNTGESIDNTHRYIGNITRRFALELILRTGGIVLPAKEHFRFRKLLQKGIEEKTILDGNKQPINSKLINLIYRDLTEACSHWRGEWVDDTFKQREEILYLEKNHKLSDKGELVPKYSEPIEECLTEHGLANLSSINSQGFPTRRSEEQNYNQRENIYFWPPIEGRVTWFYADSVSSNFGCYWGVGSSDSSLGVRRAEIVS